VAQTKEKRKERNKEYYLKNRERIVDYQRGKNNEYRLKNKERIKEQKRGYYLKNKERYKEDYLKNREQRKEYNKKYYSKNKEHIKEYNSRPKNIEHRKEYRLKNKEKRAKSQKKYNLKNIDKIKEYRLKNREHILEQKRNYYYETREHVKEYNSRPETQERRRNRINNRYNTDINFRLVAICRSRTLKALKGFDKSAPTMELIGCTPDELRTHIESKFEPWMTWENQGVGGWDVEHIKPMSKFDFRCPVQQRACCHWSNLQPMEHLENIKKGNK
tara:strand:+ start:761 stop:1582 length:822 start_codon:yes stop_codon:yes gene_type:complete